MRAADVVRGDSPAAGTLETPELSIAEFCQK
jgi:hypothetical protein